MKGKDLRGTIAVITGASSGIGREMTKHLAQAGCHVIMVVRKQAAGEYAAKELREGFSSGMAVGELEVLQCDLASFTQIRAFAANLQARNLNIDFLVLNAAVKATPKWYTKEGHELQMGVNFIGHFHLVQLLLPSLQRQQGALRIVAVTCKGELDPALRMTDLNFSKVNYDPLRAYKGSKMALALFAKELAARTAGSNITVYAADPGNTGATSINKYGGPLMAISMIGKPFLKTVSQAAATPLFCLVAPETESTKRRTSFRSSTHGIHTGTLLSECKTVTKSPSMRSSHHAERVWQEAEQLVQRSVPDSHIANKGFEGESGRNSLFVLNYILKPMMDFFMRMLGLKKY
jgi:NAD(P)-dependent dehydrogenase (short-subunit alcohol dehydrogenase family)